MTTFEWVQVGILLGTIVAIFAGPIWAVKITQDRQDKKEVRERKLQVFRDVMRTRGVQIDPVHVAALNVIEIDFYSDATVISAFRDYIKHLNKIAPEKEPEINAFLEDRYDLFLSLTHSMGKHLGYNFDKRELQQTKYAPVRWFDDQDLQRNNGLALADLLSGRTTFPIEVRQANPEATDENAELLREYLQGQRPIPVVVIDEERGFGDPATATEGEASKK